MFRWAGRIGSAAGLFWRVVMAVALIGELGLATPAAADVSGQPTAVHFYKLSSGRIGAIVGVLLGLTGAVIGGKALARSADRTGTGNVRRGATVALVLGPIGLLMGALVVATADGGLGTGHGLGGGIVAMIVGPIGMALGGVALARSRRTS